MAGESFSASRPNNLPAEFSQARAISSRFRDCFVELLNFAQDEPRNDIVCRSWEA